MLSNDSLRKKAFRPLSTTLFVCIFIVGVLIQVITQPMGIDPVLCRVNLFLYFYENKFATSKENESSIHGFKYHSVMRFIGHLCAINDCVDVGKSFTYILPP